MLGSIARSMEGVKSQWHGKKSYVQLLESFIHILCLQDNMVSKYERLGDCNCSHVMHSLESELLN